MRTKLEIKERISNIRKTFESAIGARIAGYSTAELERNGVWSAWPDLPIRLKWGSGNIIAVSWSRFDDLWIANDLSLPFPDNGYLYRWVHNSFDTINVALGATIQSVMLGRGDMSMGRHDIEIWTRLMIQTDRDWLEIFNALDENGYDFHLSQPAGIFQTCI